jgi:hypothetical protein
VADDVRLGAHPRSNPRISQVPTPYRVVCSSCDYDHQVAYYLTPGEFRFQNAVRKGIWRCPMCAAPADFDHDNFNAWEDTHDDD